MPTRKRKLSNEEQRKFRALILRLQAAGIATGASAGLLLVPKRLDVRQLEYLFSRVHDLPDGQVVVILYCELMAMRAGATVRDCVIGLPWGPELDLGDPEYIPWYDDLIRGLPMWRPTVLNRWLTGEHSLPRGRKLTGIIIATGWGPVPAEYPDEAPVDIELVISDDQGNQLEFPFKAGVDRSVKRKDQQRARKRREFAAATKRVRVPIFRREETPTREPSRTTQNEGTGPISPSPVVVSVEKPIGGSSLDVLRDETDEPIGTV
jgi:hypothetical protein